MNKDGNSIIYAKSEYLRVYNVTERSSIKNSDSGSFWDKEQ